VELFGPEQPHPPGLQVVEQGQLGVLPLGQFALVVLEAQLPHVAALTRTGVVNSSNSSRTADESCYGSNHHHSSTWLTSR
jgi:hypothetical protein